MPLEKVNLDEKLQQFSEHWNPKIVGELNGQHVKLAKLHSLTLLLLKHHANFDEDVIAGHCS
jgi:hypothetical protein